MPTLHTMGRPSGLPLSLLSQAIYRVARAELEDLAQSLIDLTPTHTQWHRW